MKYEKKITGSMKQNPKQFFKYLNSKRKIKSGVSELKDNKGNLCNDVQENANILGEFFASTFVQEPADENFLNGATNLNPGLLMVLSPLSVKTSTYINYGESLLRSLKPMKEIIFYIKIIKNTVNN